MDRLLRAVIAASLVLLVALPGAPAQDSQKVKPTALPFNTSTDEDEPHVADGGLTFYYSVKRGKNDDLMIASRRTAGGAWGKGKQLEGWFVEGDDYRSCYATTGTYPRYLFVATRDKKGGNFDLFVSFKNISGSSWIRPVFVVKVNTRQDEMHPWIGDGGKALYFSRRTKMGWVQMVSNRTTSKGPQGWQGPVEVGLPAGFHHATLTPNGKTMYVQGPLEKGRWGLFVVTREGKGWGKPRPLDALNNSDAKTGDRSPSLSRDGRVLYFASDRPGGKGGLDVYYVLTEKLAKK